MADLLKTNALGQSSQGFGTTGTISAKSGSTTLFEAATAAPAFKVGDVVSSAGTTYYVASVDTTAKTFELSTSQGGAAVLNTTTGLVSNLASATFTNFFESQSSDLITGAAGLQDIKVAVDADATIGANSTVKSAAVSSNVTGDSASLADIGFNSGLKSSNDTVTNTISVKSDAGLSGIATTTGSASASTSAGTASAFANLTDAAGIQDLDRLTVGGELTGLGKSLNTLSATAENVVGASNAASELATKIEGFEGAQMGIKSDASLQGLAQFSNAAAASTSTGNADAEAFAQQLQGVDLQGLMVGGTANVTGQATLSNLSAADAVTGNAEAESKMGTGAQGLVATGALVNDGASTPVDLAAKGIDVASDAGLTGLSSITNNATAKTSAGSVDAVAEGTSVEGASLNTVKVGGVGTIGGQATYNAKATAENVSGDHSTALADFNIAKGLDATAALDIKSDATIQGLTSISNEALASGTASTGTGSTAIAEANTLQGAKLANDTDIGGIGSITGQVNFGSKATAENVGGAAKASASVGDQNGAAASYTLDSATLSTNTFTTTDSDKSSLSVGDKVAVSGKDYFITDVNTTNGTFKIANSLENALKGNALDASGLTNASITADSFASKVVSNNPFDGGLAQGLVTGTDVNSTYGTDIKSDATVKGLSTLNVQAAANTTAGVADADAYAGIIDGASLGDVQIGGIGTLAGQSTFTGKATSSNVTGTTSTADATLVDADGMSAMAGLKISSDAGITGLNTANLSAIAESTGGASATSATANASAQVLQGAELGAATIGGIGNITGQTSFTSLADASNVTGSASATGNLGQNGGFAEGLDLSGLMDVKSDATVKGLASINSTANAETTKGDAQAVAQSDLINGADLSGGRVDIGGLGSITGQANFNFNATAKNVEGVSSGLGVDATADSDFATGLIGKTGTAAADNAGIDVSSDATLSGMAIGSLKASASSTADSATAKAGAGDSATGALLPSLNVGGIANLSAAAQLDSASTATNVGSSGKDATAEAGIGQNVTGLASGDSTAVVTGTADYAGTNLASVLPADHTFGALNINVASDATLSTQGFSNLDATAATTGGDAFANAGGAGSIVTGIASDMDIKIGGIGNLTALAQGTADASAESVTGDAKAFSVQAANGALELEMQTMSDATLSSTAKVVGSADAMSTGNLSTVSTTIGDEAWASMDFDATGIEGLALGSGGVGNLSATANVIGTANAEGVASLADARGSIDAIGMNDVWMNSSSDGTVSGIGLVNAGVTASSTADRASAEGDFDAMGISNLQMGVGGVATLKGQTQVTANMSADSVAGNASAFSGFEGMGAINSGPNFDVDASSITGLSNIELDGASNGTILGTASGAFNTSAESVTGNANAQASQILRGINTLNLDLGGNGGINAIVNDTNFVEAHSVSGNATAVASVDAIGLNGGNIHIAGNASIMANVGVDSKAEAGTIG